MSADNWRDCPRCSRLGQEKLAAAYGEVSQEEYAQLEAEVAKGQRGETLSEYYEIGLNSAGRFYADYSARCIYSDPKTGAIQREEPFGCGFAFNFHHEEEVSA